MNPRPPKRTKRRAHGLHVDVIAQAALELVDAEGMSALSARRLAAALGCEAMSLYNHVANMGEVHDLVVDELLKTLLAQKAPKDRRKAITELAQSYLGLARAHPNAFPLIAMRRWRTRNALQFASILLAHLEALGCSPRAALRVLRILSAYMHGAGMVLAAWETSEPSPPLETLAPPLSKMASSMNAAAVQSDLEVGLSSLLDSNLG